MQPDLKMTKTNANSNTLEFLVNSRYGSFFFYCFFRKHPQDTMDSGRIFWILKDSLSDSYRYLSDRLDYQ